uniref:Secreted protein n=1 Tax=Quercus lobata TaxID=97700 RepID=A0A7N2LPZ5_QUELO
MASQIVFMLPSLACLLAVTNVTATRDLYIKPRLRLVARLETNEDIIPCWNMLYWSLNLAQMKLSLSSLMAKPILAHGTKEGNILRGYCDAEALVPSVALAASPLPQA